MSLSCEILRGKAEPVGGRYRRSGALVTGAALTVGITRSSDGLALDFADLTFRSSPATPTADLTETPAGSGRYVYVFDTAAIANPVAAGVDETYDYDVIDTTNGAALPELSGEIRVRGLAAVFTSAVTAAAQATSAASSASTAATQSTAAASSAATAVTNLAAAQADLTAIKGPSFTTGDDLHSARAALAALPTSPAPTAAQISTQVASDLAAAHGAGSWLTGAQAGDAMTLTSGERTTLAGAVNTALTTSHGSGSWQTANVSALATTAQLTTALAGVPAAFAALSLASYTDPTTLGGAIHLLREWLTWTPLTPNTKAISGQNLLVRRDDGSTITVPLSGQGGTVSPVAGETVGLG